jgi:hypothetical protein
MAGLALSASPVVRLLYGDKWLGVAPVLSMIALAEILLVALPLSTDLGVLMGRLNQLIALYGGNASVADPAGGGLRMGHAGGRRFENYLRHRLEHSLRPLHAG